MIRFRQKTYAAPAILGKLMANGGGMMAATTGISVVDGHIQSNKASKENEELAEQQARDAAKTRKALEKLANSGASQEQKEGAASLFSTPRLFAAPAGFVKNATGVGKDLWNHFKPGMKSAAKMGAGFAAVGYVGNRLAASLKNHDEGRDDKNVSFLKKAAATAATVGGGIYAAKKGFFMPNSAFGKKTMQFMGKNGAGGKALKTAKNVLNPIQRSEGGKIDQVGTGFNAMFMAAPTLTYLAQKATNKNMANSSMNSNQQQYDEGQYPEETQQRQYGFVQSGKQMFNAVRNQSFGRTLTGGFNKLANTFGMMGTKGGTQAVQDSMKTLKANSKNEYTKKLADLGMKHKYMANIAQGGAALAIGGAAMKAGENLINKPMKLVDKEAYKMEEEQNGTV